MPDGVVWGRKDPERRGGVVPLLLTVVVFYKSGFLNAEPQRISGGGE